MFLHLVNACSHLQNASKARLGLTSLPHVKHNLMLAEAMHRAGLLASVTRGGPSPPTPDEVRSGEPEPVTTANVASRRLWVGLKYHADRPVLRAVKAVSKPKRIIVGDLDDLRVIARGFNVRNVKGLTLGECMFVKTDRGVLEIREALERRVGGVIMCRTS